MPVDLGVDGFDELVEIGRGGFGVVFRARQRDFGRLVVIKVLTGLIDERARRRFDRERQSVGRLSGHPNIVTVHASGFTADGSPYLVMEYLAGGSLADRVKQGPMLWPEALDIGATLASALQAAHDAGVLHRDIKPDNVLVSDRGEPKLADFGIAVLADAPTTMVGFTPVHAAPEVLGGKSATAASDVYSLASTIFTLITARPPFTRDTDDSVLPVIARVTSEPLPDLRPAGIPDRVCVVLEQAMSKDPAARIASGGELGRRFRDARAGGFDDITVVAPPGPPVSDAAATPPPATPPPATPAPATLPPAAPPSPVGPRAILQQAPELDWVAPTTSAEPKISGPADLEREPFVGRRSELERLDAALGDARAGRGRLVLVAGEPGIGKSRLARVLADQARGAGVEVLWGRAWVEEGAPAFWPWIQVLRALVAARNPEQLRALLGSDADAAVLAQLVPALKERLSGLPEPPPLESAPARFRLFDVVTALLRRTAAERPLMLVLDDLHGADTPSLRLLEFLVRDLENACLLVVATYRDVDAARDDVLAGVFNELAREPVTRRLRLEGLSEADVGRFVTLVGASEPAPALVAALHDRTNGNPFFLAELVRWLGEEGGLADAAQLNAPLPHGVLDAVRRRLAALPTEGREVLTLAAVAGSEFSLRTLEEATELASNAVLGRVEEAAAAGLVSETPRTPGRYRFTHALVRDALYETLSGTRRARLHHRIGEALEKVRARDIDSHLAELAHHFLSAAPEGGTKALAYATRAGERAMALLAYEEAARLFELALTRADDEEQRCQLLVALADAQIRAGDTAAARASFQRAADTAKTINASEPFARAALGLSDPYPFGIFDEHLVGLLEEALGELSAVDSTLRADVLGRLAIALYWAPPATPPPGARHTRERATRLSKQAVAVARRTGDRRALARALHARHYALWGPDQLEERLDLADEIVQLGEASGDRELTATGHAWRIADLAELGDFALVDIEIDAYARLAEELRLPQYRPWASLYGGMRALMEGRFDEAERLCLHALQIGADVPGVVVSCGVQMFMLRRAQGRLAELEDGVREFVAQQPGLPSWRAPLALIYAATGRVEAARAEIDRFGATGFANLPRNFAWLTALTILAEVCARLGDVTNAQALYELLLPFELRCASPFAVACTGSVAYELGQLAAVSREWDVACRHFTVAAETNERIGALPYLARTRYHHARVLLARDAPGDRKTAAELLGRAIDTANALHMTELVEAAQAELAGAPRPS